MTKKKSTHKKDNCIPFPKDGGFSEYFFWFISEHTTKFIIILISLVISAGFLLSDVGRYKDMNGKIHWTVNKKAMQNDTINKLLKIVK